MSVKRDASCLFHATGCQRIQKEDMRGMAILPIEANFLAPPPPPVPIRSSVPSIRQDPIRLRNTPLFCHFPEPPISNAPLHHVCDHRRCQGQVLRLCHLRYVFARPLCSPLLTLSGVPGGGVCPWSSGPLSITHVCDADGWAHSCSAVVRGPCC